MLTWLCFQETEEEKERREKREYERGKIDAFDLLYNPMTGQKESAYYMKNRLMCQKLCNNSSREYTFLYEEMPILEMYKYAAIGLANYHITK
jgi:hypothetical protein